jgi:hypothetical protein
MTEPVYVLFSPLNLPRHKLESSHDSQHRNLHKELPCELLELLPPSFKPHL